MVLVPRRVARRRLVGSAACFRRGGLVKGWVQSWV